MSSVHAVVTSYDMLNDSIRFLYDRYNTRYEMYFIGRVLFMPFTNLTLSFRCYTCNYTQTVLLVYVIVNDIPCTGCNP